MSEKNDRQCMRNWSLKTVAGFAVLLEKIALHCPEAENEIFRCKYNLAEIEKRIRENQPPPDPRVREDRPKTRRIFVS